MEFIIRSRTLSLLICMLLSLTSLASRAATPDHKTLLVYGDSLSAAYGLESIKAGHAASKEAKRSLAAMASNKS